MNNKNIKTLNKKKNLLNRKKLFILTGASIIAAVPVVASVSVSNNSANFLKYRGAYGLGNNKFDSYNQLMQYVNSNAEVVRKEGNNSKWTVKLNGITKTYTDPNELRQSLFKNNVTTKRVKTDVNLADYAGPKGVLGLTNPEVWKHISTDVSSNNIVYQGANDQTYLNEEDAYKSYFLTKQGYTYNGVNFSDKASLKSYLEKEYFPNWNNDNTVVITSPFGNSLPINLTKPNAQQLLNNFITENAEIRLNYMTDDGSNVDITKNNLENVMNSVDMKSLNYQHVQSNEGESRYIIDNNDEADLIGPYFYKGVLDISSFKNKDMWRKVNGVAKSVYAESRVDSTIGSFFSSIINDDNNLNKIQAEDGKTNTLLFRTLLSIPDNSSGSETKEKSYDQWFLEELRVKSPKLAEAVIKANDSMMTGKKYNSFYKIPVLYSFLMQRAVSWGLEQDVINLIIDYFTNVCNFVQDVLEFVSLFSEDLLLSKDKKQKFDMVKFFQIGNPEYDINTSTAYFLNEIKTTYPNLIALSLAYSQAETNISLAGGLIPFESISFDLLWETGLMDAKDLYVIKPMLKNVYDTFSQLKVNDMVKIYVENNQRQDIKDVANEPDTIKWEEKLKLIKTSRTDQNIWDLLSSIGAKNNQYYALAESVLNTEIKIFLESGAVINGGYLDKLVVLGKSKNVLSTFVNYVKREEGKVSTYRIYLAFILDLKYNLNLFNNESTSSSYEFARRLTYLIEVVFGSSVLIGRSFSKMYTPDKEYESIPSPISNPTTELIETASEHIYDSVAGDLWDTSINLGRANTDGKLFFSSEVFDVESDFINPSVTPSSLGNKNQSIILADLSEGIRFSSTDWHPNLIQLVKESNELKPIERRGSASIIMSTTDTASLSISNSFSFEDDTISMVNNSIYSGSWGHNIPGADPNLIGSNPNISGTYDDVYWTKQKKSWWSGHTSKFNKIKEAAATLVNNALEIFSGVLAVTELAFFIFDILKEEYTQNFYQYVTPDGTSFYWNGGWTVSKYLGFETKELSNINDMVLIDPVEITIPQIQEYYYYDGLKYFNPNELKRKVLLNYLNGVDAPRNSRFKRYYGLINNEDSTSSTINDLINKIISSLKITRKEDGSFDISNLNKNSPYIQTLSASYDYGYIISDSDNNVTLIQNIVDNIRPTNFVALPTLQGTVATGVANDVTKLPGKFWDGNKIIDNGQMTNVIMDNSANNLREVSKNDTILKQENFVDVDPKTADTKSKNNLFNKFKMMFSVASKEILDIANINSKYSKLYNSVKVENIYEVKDANTGKIYTFYDPNAASKYLMESADFTKHTDYIHTKIYFEGMYFDSRDDLLKWVHQNMFSI